MTHPATPPRPDVEKITNLLNSGLAVVAGGLFCGATGIDAVGVLDMVEFLWTCQKEDTNECLSLEFACFFSFTLFDQRCFVLSLLQRFRLIVQLLIVNSQ
jgi:hypothetical protein